MTSLASASALSLALLIFRTPLLIQNAVVLLGALSSKAIGRGRGGRRLAPLMAAVLSVIAVGQIVTNPESVLLFGIYAEHRVLGSSAMLDLVDFYGADSTVDRFKFPLVYLFIETAGLSPESWLNFNSSWLRGVLALPWIALVVPFFVLGIRWLLRVPNGVVPKKNFISRLRQSRIVATPWSAVALFILVSFAISWTVGDTTRWRIPDLPFVAAIALAGWFYTSRTLRLRILVLWGGGSGTLFGLFYLLRIF